MDEKMTNFIVGSSYKPLDVIGEGAYGTVWSVTLGCERSSIHLSSKALQFITRHKEKWQ